MGATGECPSYQLERGDIKVKRIMYAVLLTGVLGVQNLEAQKAGEDFYASIGRGGVGRRTVACRGTFSSFCVGWIGAELSKDSTTANDEALIAKLSEERWEAPAAPTRRTPRDKSLSTPQWPMHTIQSMPNPKKIQLSSMSKHGLVVARIIADPTGPVDARYGIGGMVSAGVEQLSSTFYLVVKNYNPADEKEGSSSRRVADWSIYHVQGEAKKRRLKRVGSQGSFYWCRHAHETAQTQRAAQFMTCEGYTELENMQKEGFFAKALASSPASLATDADKVRQLPIDQLIRFVRSMPAAGADSARIVRAQRLLDSEKSPAWVTCGVGCCTADESPTTTKVP